MSGKESDDIPPALHRKLVCVAKRGRFSHIVPPRVWQAPDGRAIQILDDAKEPLDEHFYEALVALEKREEEKERNRDNETVDAKEGGQGPAIDSSEGVVVVTNLSPSSAQHSSSTSANDGPRDPTPAALGSASVAKPNKKLTGKKGPQSLTDWFKRAGEPEKQRDEATATMKKPSPPKVEEPRGREGRVSSPVNLSTSSSTRAPLPTTAHHYNPAHCLIHKWDPSVRSRCFVYPSTPSGPPHHLTQGTTSPRASPVCLVWFRYGCLRIEQNLALQQAVWLSRAVSHCRVVALAFLPPIHEIGCGADATAHSAALFDVQGRLGRDIAINMHVIKQPEETAAVPLFALWTRQAEVIGIFTSESYHPSAGRVSASVARAVKCPLFAFDSDHPIPIRFIESRLQGPSHIDFESTIRHAFQGKPLPFQSLLGVSSDASDDHLVGQPMVPEIVMTRFGKDMVSPSEVRSYSSSSWTERSFVDSRQEMLNGPLERILPYVRLGTVSPIGLLVSPEWSHATQGLIQYTHRVFSEWLRTHEVAPPHQSKSSHSPSADEVLSRVSKAFELCNTEDERWNWVARHLRSDSFLGDSEIEFFVSRGREMFGDSGNALQTLLSRHLVGGLSIDLGPLMSSTKNS